MKGVEEVMMIQIKFHELEQKQWIENRIRHQGMLFHISTDNMFLGDSLAILIVPKAYEYGMDHDLLSTSP